MQPQSITPAPPTARSYLEILRTYWWLLLTTSLIGAILAAISAFRAPAVYRAAAQLLIERAAPQVVNLPEVLPSSTDSSDYYPTQYGIMKSRALAREVVAQLALHEHPEFVGRPEEKRFSLSDLLTPVRGAAKALLDSLVLRPPPTPSGLTAGGVEPDQWIIDAFLSRLKVEPVRNTRLVTISFEGRDPAIITQIINTLAEAYMQRTVELRYNAAQVAMHWLEGKVGEERQRIERAEQALQNFREREDILSPEGGEEILVRKIETLNDMYIQMRVKRLEMDSQSQMMQRIAKDPKQVEAFPLVMQNQFIQTLKANFATLAQDLSELTDRYGYKHPSMQRKELQLDALKSNVSLGVEQVRQSMEMQAQLGRLMEDYVRSLIDETKREVFAFHKKAVQYGVLQREMEAQKEIYNLLLRRLNETGVTDQLRLGNASLIDPAEVPNLPVKPQKTRSTLMGLLFGFGAGLAVVFGLRSLDSTIRTPDNVEQGLGLPYVGTMLRFRPPHDAGARGELIVHLRPHSAEAEAVRKIRTGVMLVRAELPSRAVLITSVAPQEGKTVVVANLAIALAQAGRKVLLVDADMRKPRLGTLFPGENDGPRLVQLLSTDLGLDAAVRPTDIEHLSLLPCVATAEHPSELLESPRLLTVIAAAKERFDFVLFDSPPLLAVTDAVVLASRVDGVVLVVKGGSTPRELLRRGIAMLTDAHAAPAGGVLNMVDLQGRHAPYETYGYQYYRRQDDREGRA
jgi:polysaccharide biosynthesis transport protein